MDQEPDYQSEPSYDIRDALLAVLLFHNGAMWDANKVIEWKRITGTREATTKVLCDHIRSAAALLRDQQLSQAAQHESEIEELRQSRAGDQHRLFHYERIIADMRQALSFAQSVIKSGESWTDQCEKMIGGMLKETREI